MQPTFVDAYSISGASVSLAQGGKQVPAEAIQVVSKPRENGYEIAALIPLSPFAWYTAILLFCTSPIS